MHNMHNDPSVFTNAGIWGYACYYCCLVRVTDQRLKSQQIICGTLITSSRVKLCKHN